MNMTNIHLHEFPGLQVSLEYQLPETVNSLEALTQIGLDAVEQIRGNQFEFFCVDVDLGIYDKELWYAKGELPQKEANYLVQVKNPPPMLKCETFYVDQKIEWLDDLQKDKLIEKIKTIASTKEAYCDEDSIILWHNITFRVVKIHLPTWKDQSISLESGGKTFSYPVEKNEDGFIAYGPLKDSDRFESPFSITLSNDQGNHLNLNIQMLWSYWTNDDLEGAIIIKKALKLLQAQGWQLSLSEVSYAAV